MLDLLPASDVHPSEGQGVREEERGEEGEEEGKEEGKEEGEGTEAAATTDD